MLKENSSPSPFVLPAPFETRPPNGRTMKRIHRERDLMPPMRHSKNERHVLHSRLREILRAGAWEKFDEYDEY